MKCLVRFFGWHDIVFFQGTKVSLGIHTSCDGIFAKLPNTIVQQVRQLTREFFSNRPYRKVCDLARPLPAWVWPRQCCAALHCCRACTTQNRPRYICRTIYVCTGSPPTLSGVLYISRPILSIVISTYYTLPYLSLSYPQLLSLSLMAFQFGTLTLQHLWRTLIFC